MLAANTILQGRYRIIRLIAQGGMGAVYEAKDERLGSTVALKQTLTSGGALQKAFEREARILAQLRHPALPKVSDYFSEQNGQFLVMEYIGGDDFKTLLKQQGGPFAVTMVLKWADQLLNALEFLHGLQPPIIHRDIKPANIKLSPRGEVILLDFGLSKGGSVNTARLAAGGKSLPGFTPNYAPIEQIRGTGTDERSDLYSLGATLYHLLTNSPPVQALRRTDALSQGKADPLRPLVHLNPQVSPTIANVIMQALALNAAKRPSSAKEMRTALRKASTSPVPMPDVQISKRILPFFWLTDYSGSMKGKRIASLNQAIREALPAIRNALAAHPEVQIMMRAIKFATRAEWHVGPAALPLAQFAWPELKAGGLTATAQAIRLLTSELTEHKMPRRGYPPVCILVSDGYCTDSQQDYERAIAELEALPWGKKAVRLVIAIGNESEYNEKQLLKFVSHKNIGVLKAHTPGELVNHIEWASVMASVGASLGKSKIGQGMRDTNNVNLPLPPAPGIVSSTDIF